MHFAASPRCVRQVLYEAKSANLPRVLQAGDLVGMMNAYMMRQTIAEGTATKDAFDWPAAGKTGTSQKSRDAWFDTVGYTANLTTGVWFGNDDGAPWSQAALPALAWHEFMVAAHDGVPVAALPGGWKSSRRFRAADPLTGVEEDPVAALPPKPYRMKPRRRSGHRQRKSRPHRSTDPSRPPMSAVEESAGRSRLWT